MPRSILPLAIGVACLCLPPAHAGEIGDHQADRTLITQGENAAFVWSNGTSAAGKAQLKANFARDVADPAFVTYDRAPESLSISDTGLRAVEHGTWSALKREPRGETRYGGDYLAHWAKTPQDG
jgi:hypothetical protein